MAINVVVFFLERFGTDASVIDRFGLWPYGVHAHSQYYRAFTAMWLHADFLHIAGNMLALLIVGPALEVQLGKVRFVALYLIAGLGGSVASYLLSPPYVVGIGASGAIMGVMGAYVVLGMRRRLPIAPVVALIVLNLLIGFSGNIDWRAHLGGLATGATLAYHLRRRRPPARPPGRAGPDRRGQPGRPRPPGPAPHRGRAGPRELELSRGRRWLTLRQNPPYCFMSGCANGQV